MDQANATAAATGTQSAVEAAALATQNYNAAFQNTQNLVNAIDAGQLTTGTAFQAAGNIGRDFVAAAQPFVDPLEIYGPESGTVLDAIRAGGTGGEIAKNLAIASGKALTVPAAEVVTDFGLDYYEAMQQAEDDYREYLDSKPKDYPKGSQDQDIFRYLEPHFYPRIKVDYENRMAFR